VERLKHIALGRAAREIQEDLFAYFEVIPRLVHEQPDRVEGCHAGATT
jgi:hypothetical protein